jgi:hypothetical protein
MPVSGTDASLKIPVTSASSNVARRIAPSVVELAVGAGLLVATFGFELSAPSGSGFHFGYGSVVGFSAAALLLVLAVVRLRPPRFDRNRLFIRLVPITACLAYLVIVVLPWWDVLPRRLQAQSLARFSPPSWLTVAGALLAIHLLASWARRIANASGSADRLVLLPLALLVLAALDLIRLAVPSAEAEETRAEIRALEADGTTHVYPIELKPDLCRLPDEDETALVDAIIDVPESTTSFELLLDGKPVSSFHVGDDPGPPAKNLELKTEQSKERGAAAPDDVTPWKLSWEGTAGSERGIAEDNRSYVVQASIDEGNTWTTLAVGAKRNTLDVDPTNFAGADHVRFRVLTTNGVSYSEATTDDLVLEEV